MSNLSSIACKPLKFPYSKPCSRALTRVDCSQARLKLAVRDFLALERIFLEVSNPIPRYALQLWRLPPNSRNIGNQYDPKEAVMNFGLGSIFIMYCSYGHKLFHFVGILEEIRHYNADVVSLQEVETEQFYQFFLPEFEKDGYQGIFAPKSRAKTMQESEAKYVDGCAIFWKSSK